MKGNKDLSFDFGIPDPILGLPKNWNKQSEVNKMGEYKEAKTGDVYKFEKEGDAIEGKFMNYEESKQYKDSYAVRLKQGEDVKVVFVSKIVPDLIMANSIKQGQQIKVEFQGKKKTQDGKREYNDYKVYFQ